MGQAGGVVVGPKTGSLVAHWEGGGHPKGVGMDGRWELVQSVRDHGESGKQRCRRELWSDLGE